MKNEHFEQAIDDRESCESGVTMVSSRGGRVVVVNELGTKLVGILVGTREDQAITWKRYERAEMSFKDASDEVVSWQDESRQGVAK